MKKAKGRRGEKGKGRKGDGEKRRRGDCIENGAWGSDVQGSMFCVSRLAFSICSVL